MEFSYVTKNWKGGAECNLNKVGGVGTWQRGKQLLYFSCLLVPYWSLDQLEPTTNSIIFFSLNRAKCTVNFFLKRCKTHHFIKEVFFKITSESKSTTCPQQNGFLLFFFNDLHFLHLPPFALRAQTNPMHCFLRVRWPPFPSFASCRRSPHPSSSLPHPATALFSNLEMLCRPLQE